MYNDYWKYVLYEYRWILILLAVAVSGIAGYELWPVIHNCGSILGLFVCNP